MMNVDLNSISCTGLYKKEQVSNTPNTLFAYDMVEITEHTEGQVCILINTLTKEIKGFIRRRFKDGSFGLFYEIRNPREVLK